MRRLLCVLALILWQGLTALEPRLHCDKVFGEMTWEGMEFHRYKLRAENFPPEKTFRLIVKSFDGTQTETFTYHSNKRGHLILDPKEKAEEDMYAICPAKKGERISFLMRSEEVTFTTDVVPFPLHTKSKKGARLNLELQGEKGEKFLLTVTGLKANEKVDLAYSFNEEKHTVDAAVTPLGELITFVSFPADQEGGQALLTLKRKQEEVILSFEWGPPALRIVGACCFEIK